MKPKVSVLVITYNHERYIKAALEGVFAQETTFPIEVVISDDASTDGTRSIVGEFAARYPDQVRLSFREKNCGDGGNENFLLGLEMCRGEYIATLDGDDYWTDIGKLQRQADLLDARSDYPLYFHNCKVEYENGDREPWEMVHRPFPMESVTTRDLLKDAMVQALSLKGQPAWLEPYCAGYGLTGDELLRKLTQRLRLYRFPMLFRLWFPLERLMAEVRWRRLDATVQMRSHLRLERGEAVVF